MAVICCVVGLLALCLSALIGGKVGRYRGRESEGQWFGFFLGPVGWIIAALLPEEGERCPECLGVVSPQARRCRHCGGALAKPPLIT